MTEAPTTEQLVERVRKGLWRDGYDSQVMPEAALTALQSRIKELERQTDMIDLFESRAERAEAEVLRLREALPDIEHALQMIEHARGERPSVNLTLAGIRDDLERARAALSEKTPLLI